MEDAAGRQGEHMQETSPTGTTLEVGVMLTELNSGYAGISGLMGIQTQASAKTPMCPWTKFKRGCTQGTTW